MVTGDLRPIPRLRVLGGEILEAHLECLGERVTEDVGGGGVPQYDLAGPRVRDDHRVPHGLEQPAYAQLQGQYGHITHGPQRCSEGSPSSSQGSGSRRGFLDTRFPATPDRMV